MRQSFIAALSIAAASAVLSCDEPDAPAFAQEKQGVWEANPPVARNAFQTASKRVPLQDSENDSICGDARCARGYETATTCPYDCHPLQATRCAAYMDCLALYETCEAFCARSGEADCILQNCQRCETSDEIASAYADMLACAQDFECSESEVIDWECMGYVCEPETEACLPSVPGDGYCGPFETGYESFEECHRCGDGYCGSTETPESCAFDCAPMALTNCAEAYDCQRKLNSCLDNCLLLNEDNEEEAYACISQSCVSCEEFSPYEGDAEAFATCAQNCPSTGFAACIAESCQTEFEDCFISAEDGDGVCSPLETLDSSPADCAVCGDGNCTAASESIQNCARDCANAGPANATCEGAIDVSNGGVFTSHNFLSGNNYQGTPGNDVFFALTLSAPATLTLTTGPDQNQRSGGMGDTYLWLLRGDCDHLADAAVVAQNNDFAFSNYSQIKRAVDAGHYIVVVENPSSSSPRPYGAFALTVRIDCPPGQFKADGACTACSPIAHCTQSLCSNASDALCIQCDEGYLFNEDGSACITCDPIEHCVSGGTQCDANGQNAQCSACIEGYKLSEDLSACDPDPSDAEVDASIDAEVDAETDASIDAEVDAQADAEVDTSIDAEIDAQADAEADASIDAEVDTSIDAEVDTSIDAEIDADADAEVDANNPDANNPDANNPDADFEPYDTSDSGCSALPSPASNAFLALLALPFLALRRRTFHSKGERNRPRA